MARLAPNTSIAEHPLACLDPKGLMDAIQGVGILTFRIVRGGGGMADALVSGASDRKVVEVQLLSAAPAETIRPTASPGLIVPPLTTLARSPVWTSPLSITTCVPTTPAR